ncbi:hypothetical protein JKA73_18930 [Myxococcus xanthus]|uniref:hypothetical protein n=1 Tax=Myxococcus xanthus TaxID=34 RepID=UPI0019179661|nr:hypothetical protein [Myxococcus xanthus]QQR47988.1 hypothetical protein JKA73_18930 [Myxococcus xanthus]
MSVRTLVLRASLRPLVGVVSAVLLTLAPTACRREPPAPSAEYEEAARRFRELYAQKLDEAFLDPQVGEIEAQLQRVPADSLDAEGARELLQRIKDGRQRMAAAVNERDEAVASARELPPGSYTAPSTEEQAPPAAPVEAPDAGSPDAGAGGGPQAGTAASELVAGFRGCFQRGTPIDVQGRGMRETWQLADRTACRLEYPQHQDSFLLIEEGKVLTLLPKSAVQTVPVTPDGGPAPATDAGR